MILETAVSIVASVVVTWIVAHLYYQRGSRYLQSLVDKLPDVLVERLALQPQHKLTLDELEELIHEADAFPTDFGIFPNKCPECGSKLDFRGDSGSEYHEPEMWAECPACGWMR